MGSIIPFTVVSIFRIGVVHPKVAHIVAFLWRPMIKRAGKLVHSAMVV